ncbi:MAG TPA: 1,4-dihydroxy-2-naphthoate polyprenyltransferase [Pelomicrobium sp.]|nr:1,4-dihydroxy-2-naphthoate polyprenyltransferase [Pelomicrobium sp.]
MQSASAANARPTRLTAWWLAIRPKTLTVAVAPVACGAALAWHEHRQFFLAPFLVTLVVAVLIQIATNLYNDAKDHERGADTPDRLGPARATASGWLTAREVKRAALGTFAAAFVLGQYLVWHGGWGILLLGVVSIGAGIAYTGGPRPIAYSATGEVFVWLFFGLAATLGTYYLQAFTLSVPAFLTANALGLLAAAVIVVNNTRDLETDTRAGKHTLAVRIGRAACNTEYAALMLLPFALVAAQAPLLPGGARMLLPLLALPWALALVRRFRAEPPGRGFNRLLARTAALQLAFALLLALALIL